MVRLGAEQGLRSVDGIWSPVSRKWTLPVISCQFCWAQILPLDSNKNHKVVQVYAPSTADDDNEGENFYDELKPTLTAKSTYTVPSMPNLNAEEKSRRGTLVGTTLTSKTTVVKEW